MDRIQFFFCIFFIGKGAKNQEKKRQKSNENGENLKNFVIF
jgi:hypothetical protein